jgi:hypothetical protein
MSIDEHDYVDENVKILGRDFMEGMPRYLHNL